jgi:hypothetical protein
MGTLIFALFFLNGWKHELPAGKIENCNILKLSFENSHTYDVDIREIQYYVISRRNI